MPSITTSVRAKVQSLADQTLGTGLGHYYQLVEGQIFVGIFKNPGTLEALVQIGAIRLAPIRSEDSKNIPVTAKQIELPTVLQDEDGKELPLSSS